MSSETRTLPPLDQAVIDEIQQLFPQIKWTISMRTEWRKRLGMYPVDRVLAAIRDTYASDSGFPSLPKILARIKATAQPSQQRWVTDQKLQDEISQQVTYAKTFLKGLSTKRKKELVEIYRKRIGTVLPSKLDEWTKNQVMLAFTLVRSEDGVKK